MTERDSVSSSAIIAKKFSLAPFPPDGVDMNDVLENGSLFSDELTQWVTKEITSHSSDENSSTPNSPANSPPNSPIRSNLLDINVSPPVSPGRSPKFSRRKGKAEYIGRDLPFSVINVMDENKNERILAVYEGKQGEGSFGSVKYVQDLETKDWMILKIIPEEKPRSTAPLIKPIKQEEDEDNEEALDSGSMVVNEQIEQTGPERKLLDEDYSGEFFILSQLSLTGGKFERISPSKNVKQTCILMTLGKGKPLADLKDISPQQFLEITHSMLKSFNDLFQNNRILHRDIKDENIMYDTRSKHLSLIDFGLAVRMPRGVDYVDDMPLGTREWTAPEIRKFLDIGTITNLLTELQDALVENVKNRQTIDIINRSLDEKSAPSELNALLKQYASEMKDVIAFNAEKINKIQSSLDQGRLRKQKQFVNEYLDELSTDKNPDENKVRKITELSRTLKLLKEKPELEEAETKKILASFVSEYKSMLAMHNKILDKKIEQIENYEQRQQLSINDPQTKNQFTNAYQDLLTNYLEGLTKRSDAQNRNIQIDLNSINELNTALPDHISGYFGAAKGEEDNTNHQKHKREDIQDLITNMTSYMKGENQKDIDTIKKDITVLKTRLEEQSKLEFKQVKAANPNIIGENNVRYSEQSEMVSIGYVILNMLTKVNDLNFRKDIVEKYFEENNNWDWKTRNPNTSESLAFFEAYLKEYQSKLNLNPSKSHNIAAIDCSQLIHKNINSVADNDLQKLIKQLQEKNIHEIVLVGHQGLSFKHYKTIRDEAEKSNITVQQDVLLQKNATPSEIIQFIKENNQEKYHNATTKIGTQIQLFLNEIHSIKLNAEESIEAKLNAIKENKIIIEKNEQAKKTIPHEQRKKEEEIAKLDTHIEQARIEQSKKKIEYKQISSLYEKNPTGNLKLTLDTLSKEIATLNETINEDNRALNSAKIYLRTLQKDPQVVINLYLDINNKLSDEIAKLQEIDHHPNIIQINLKIKRLENELKLLTQQSTKDQYVSEFLEKPKVVTHNPHQQTTAILTQALRHFDQAKQQSENASLHLAQPTKHQRKRSGSMIIPSIGNALNRFNQAEGKQRATTLAEKPLIPNEYEKIVTLINAIEVNNKSIKQLIKELEQIDTDLVRYKSTHQDKSGTVADTRRIYTKELENHLSTYLIHLTRTQSEIDKLALSKGNTNRIDPHKLDDIGTKLDENLKQLSGAKIFITQLLADPNSNKHMYHILSKSDTTLVAHAKNLDQLLTAASLIENKLLTSMNNLTEIALHRSPNVSTASEGLFNSNQHHDRTKIKKTIAGEIEFVSETSAPRNHKI